MNNREQLIYNKYIPLHLDYLINMDNNIIIRLKLINKFKLVIKLFNKIFNK